MKYGCTILLKLLAILTAHCLEWIAQSIGKGITFVTFATPFSLALIGKGSNNQIHNTEPPKPTLTANFHSWWLTGVRLSVRL